MKPSDCFLLTGFIRSAGESVWAATIEIGLPHYRHGCHEGYSSLISQERADLPFLAHSKCYEGRGVASQEVFPARFAARFPRVAFLDLLEPGVDKSLLGRLDHVERCSFTVRAFFAGDYHGRAHAWEKH